MEKVKVENSPQPEVERPRRARVYEHLADPLRSGAKICSRCGLLLICMLLRTEL